MDKDNMGYTSWNMIQYSRIRFCYLQQHRIRGHYIKLRKPDTEKERPQFSLLCGNWMQSQTWREELLLQAEMGKGEAEQVRCGYHKTAGTLGKLLFITICGMQWWEKEYKSSKLIKNDYCLRRIKCWLIWFDCNLFDRRWNLQPQLVDNFDPEGKSRCFLQEYPDFSEIALPHAILWPPGARNHIMYISMICHSLHNV